MLGDVSNKLVRRFSVLWVAGIRKPGPLRPPATVP